MIKCKEDLFDTYVRTDNEEIVKKYLDKCQEFGITWRNGQEALYYNDKLDPYLEVFELKSAKQVIVHTDYTESTSRELTLDDFEEEQIDQTNEIADTTWLQLESLKRFAIDWCYTWGGDGTFYYFGDFVTYYNQKVSLKMIQELHNFKSDNKIVDKTYLQWSKKEKKLICQKHLVKLV